MLKHRPNPLRVLLIGDARMAFPVAKALSRRGVRVFAGVSRYSNYLEWSRHVRGSFRHCSLEPGGDEAAPVILDWLDRNPVDAIQPVSEAGSRFLSRHRAVFEARAALIMPPPEAVGLCMNKTAMFALCERLEVALAPFRRVRSMAQLAVAAADVGFPLIVKPAVVDAELFGRKALIAHDKTDLERLMPGWPDVHPELIVQRYLTGPRHSVIFSADRGRLLGAVEVRAARTHEHDGTGYTTFGVTVAPTPSVREGVERLAAELNYSSTGCAQFLVSPSGEITFMELNPRVSLARIAEAAGLPHSRWGLDLALGREVRGWADPWAGAREGVRYVWTKGDVKLLASRVRSGEAGWREAGAKAVQIAADAVSCHHAIFDPLDPLPSVGTWGHRLLAPLRRFPEYEPGYAPSLGRAPKAASPLAPRLQLAR
ncbi:MAG: hypothetical protein ACK4Z5_02525 [Brevundimonas sp.]